MKRLTTVALTIGFGALLATTLAYAETRREQYTYNPNIDVQSIAVNGTNQAVAGAGGIFGSGAASGLTAQQTLVIAGKPVDNAVPLKVEDSSGNELFSVKDIDSSAATQYGLVSNIPIFVTPSATMPTVAATTVPSQTYAVGAGGAWQTTGPGGSTTGFWAPWGSIPPGTGNRLAGNNVTAYGPFTGNLTGLPVNAVTFTLQPCTAYLINLNLQMYAVAGTPSKYRGYLYWSYDGDNTDEPWIRFPIHQTATFDEVNDPTSRNPLVWKTHYKKVFVNINNATHQLTAILNSADLSMPNHGGTVAGAAQLNDAAGSTIHYDGDYHAEAVKLYTDGECRQA